MRCIYGFSLLLLHTIATASIQPCPKEHCLGVVDSGSSGTRIFVYAYDIDEYSGVPKGVELMQTNKVSPGITTIPATEAAINQYLQQLMKDTTVNDLPIYYYATAGMRLQPLARQAKYYQLISTWFANNPKYQPKIAKTISGNEEGLFGWLAINYQLNALAKPADKQFGVLDLGGASVQISFPVQNPKQANIHLKIHGKPVHIYTHSFLGMGQTEMMHHFLNYSYCFSKNYPMPGGHKGRGDWYHCVSKIDQMTNGVHAVSMVNHKLQFAPPHISWMAMGSLMTVKNSKPFEFSNKDITLDDYESQAIQKVCQQDWGALSKQYADNDHIGFYCLYPAYHYSLIVNGYGLPSSMILHEPPKSSISGWTLGVLIHEAIGA